MTETGLLESTDAALSALLLVSTDAARYDELSDADAVTLAARVAEERRLLDMQAALLAGVFAKRSAPALGGLGLAQKMGKRTPEEFVKSITGATGKEAATSVRVGRMALEAASEGQVDASTGEVFTSSEPWMRAAVSAVTVGTISVQAADAIRTGTDRPTDTVTAAMLADIVTRAVEYATTGDVDRVLRFTKDLRDQVDAAGVAEREAHRFAERSWKFTMHPDGSATSFIRHDIVGAAYIKDLFDRATSPKLPRFVDETEAQVQILGPAADTTFDERRTRDQFTYDTIMQIIMAGANADSSRLVGSTGARITVLVTKEQLDAETGVAFIDGQADPISSATVREIIRCDGTEVVPVVFDANGQALEITEKQRLFTLKQRIILTAMFGGCAFGDCDRPASWTEAHHILWVKRDGGKTVVDNGILLCRHHHLLLHNQGWEIRRTGEHGEHYWLVPPPTVDPTQTPQPIRYKSRAYQQLRAAAWRSIRAIRLTGPSTSSGSVRGGTVLRSLSRAPFPVPHSAPRTAPRALSPTSAP